MQNTAEADCGIYLGEIWRKQKTMRKSKNNHIIHVHAI